MPNKLSLFWQELKRRKVTRTITVYAAAAFVILELVDIVSPNLGLPVWTFNLVLILLLVGFVITVILSWIWDIHPEGGIVKTKPIDKVKNDDKILTNSSSWKIASYISFMVIVGLIVLNIFGGKRGARIDESLTKSIAVLPFENFSTEPDQEAMCQGITVEIINHLYRIESFDHVSSLTSVLNYRDPEKNIPEIAKELGVNYILEGVYKKVGDQIRVSAQLIKAGSDGHIWQQDYDRPYQEIISLQSEIALQIADQLKAYLTETEKQLIVKIPTQNQEAYELMQQANYLFTTETWQKRDQIMRLAQQAIDLDPDYADAYAMVGGMILSEGYYFGGKEMQSVAWEAIPYLNKALELDKDNVSAIINMAVINFFVQWDYIKAEEYFSRITDYLSTDFIPLYGYTLFLIEMGRCNEVLELIDKSMIAIDEIAVQAHVVLGNNREAYDLINSCLYAYGKPSYTWIGDLFNWLGEYDSARYYLESAMKLKDQNPEILTPRFQACLAVASYHTGAQNQTRLIINQLIKKSDTTSVGSPAFFTGHYYSWIGEVDSAFYWLEKAYNNRSPEMPWLKMDPAFNSLKDDPRYWDLYERTGHKAYDDYMASEKK